MKQCAAAHGAVEVVSYLLDQHASNPELDILQLDADGYSAVHYLALCFDKRSAMRIARRLKDVGLSIDGKTSLPHRGGGATENAHTGQAPAPNIAELGVDSDEEETGTESDEQESGTDSDEEESDFGSDEDEMDPHWAQLATAAPVTLACYMGNFSCARALLKFGASILAPQIDDHNCLELIYFAPFTGWAQFRQDEEVWENERLALMKALIAAGLPADRPGLDGMTPLMLAAKHGLQEEIRTLIDTFGARVEHVDDCGKTPLMFAFEAADEQAVKALLEAHANPNALDRFGQGPIHYVQEPAMYNQAFDDYEFQFRERRLAILGQLLRSGANCGIIDRKKMRLVDPNNPVVIDEFDLGDLAAFENTKLYSEMGHTMMPTSHRPDKDGEVFLDFILQNATRVNINEDSWRTALNHLFDAQQKAYLSAHGPFMLGKWERLCRKLANFGTKHGYLIDDDPDGDLACLIRRYPVY